MTRSRKSLPSRDVTIATTSEVLLSFDDNCDEEQNTSECITHLSSEEINEDSSLSNTNALVPEGDGTNSINEGDEIRLKSNVWSFAKKVSNEKARCIKCKAILKTPHGGTSTLRKHLLAKHNLIHLKLPSNPRINPNNKISHEKKNRLDHLANIAVFEDGRTFGDLQKRGMAKFLAEAVPDNSNADMDANDDDDDEENQDLIVDTWNDEVITGDSNNMDTDDSNEEDIIATKIELAKTIQKGRSLIKMVKRSQIIMMFINNEKKRHKVIRRLRIDCMSRWNSTFLAIQSLLKHKPVLISLFENKGKLPLTSKQKEKLGLLELSSDDYLIFNELTKIFKPFYDATNLLSSSNYPTIGLCLYVIRSMKEFLEKEDDDESNILITLKKFVLESFNYYFDENNDQHFLLTLYGYFDPFGYSALLPRERSKVERYLKQKCKEQNRSQAPTTTSSLSSSVSGSSSTSANKNLSVRKPTLLEIFLKSVGKHLPSDNFIPKTISEELANYGYLCKVGQPQDPATFWRRHGEQMPLLKAMAQQYLSAPGTSVPSESAFSSSAYIGRKERARLSPENLSYTVFLQDKLRSS